MDVKGRPSLRSEQAARTRLRIVQAAGDVFAEQGFAGARIEDIAERSGVAVPTVYKVFTNKRNLLVGALNHAMTGGEDAAIDEQSWWVEQLDEPDPARQLELIARNARRIYERTGAMLEALRAAAPLDDDLAYAWNQITEDRVTRSRKTAKVFIAKARGRARQSSNETAWTLLSLTAPELYTVHLEARRTPKQYEAWLSHVLRSALLQSS